MLLLLKHFSLTTAGESQRPLLGGGHCGCKGIPITHGGARIADVAGQFGRVGTEKRKRNLTE